MKPGKPSLAEALGGGVPDEDEMAEVDDEGGESDGGQALLDAIDAHDPAAVVAAFNALADLHASKPGA